MDNNEVRQLFEDYYIRAMKPNLRLVADKMGINYWYLIKWRNRHRHAPASILKMIVDYIKNDNGVN
jgi:hypothetical protein